MSRNGESILRGLKRNKQTYASVNSKPDYPPGRPPGNVLKGRIAHPLEHNESAKSLGAEKSCLNPIPGAMIFKNPAKELQNIRLKLRKTVLKC